MRLTDRDVRIVIAVYRYRLLSSQQIEALFFPSTGSKPHSRRSACQRRLQLLYHHGFLERIPRPLFLGEGRSPFVYALDSRGADLVAQRKDVDRADLDWKPKDNKVGGNFVEHTLAINDVRVVVNLLAGQEK